MWRILFFILCYDIWFYISHLMLHQKKMWYIHKVHHTKAEPNFLDTYLAHWFESVFQSFGLVFASIFVQATVTKFMLIIILLNIRGMMRHDARFIPLVGNHHLLHHKYSNYNFGEYWLDTIFGTKYPDKREYKFGWIYI